MPGAGEGVFSTQECIPGDIITEYSGLQVSTDDARKLGKLKDYTQHLYGNTYLVGSQTLEPGEGFGSKVNSGKPRHKANAEIVFFARGNLCFRALHEVHSSRRRSVCSLRYGLLE